MIAYSDLHTANICTKAEPTAHTPGTSVLCVICDTEGVAPTQWDRSTFNKCCNDMIADFELQCANARDRSWNFMAVLIGNNLTRFVINNGQDDVVVLRNKCLGRFQLFWAQSKGCCDTFNIAAWFLKLGSFTALRFCVS